MKKLLAIVMVAAMTLSMCVIANAADDAGYTTVEKNVDGVLTVTVSATSTEKTDVAIVYDPAVYTCDAVLATDAFEEKKAEKTAAGKKCFMGDYVVNEKATTDDGAATYAMFTSAISKASEDMPDWDYSGEFAVFKFSLVEGKTSADATDLIIVADSASKSKTADDLAATPLKKLAGADVKAIFDTTPAPADTEPPTPTNPSDNQGGADTDNNNQGGANTDNNNQGGANTNNNNQGGTTTTPAPGGKAPAAQTADVAPVATMVTLVLMAGAVLVVLKKRAAE